jgi:hypothetical protein
MSLHPKTDVLEAVYEELQQQRRQEDLRWLLDRMELRDGVLRSILNRFDWRKLRPNGFPPSKLGV